MILASSLEKMLKDRNHPLFQSISEFCRGRMDDVRYEIDHVLTGLRTIAKIEPYFGPRTELSLAFMPRNWPLYSFLLFCLTSAAHADKVIVHYPDSIKGRVLPMMVALEACVKEVAGVQTKGPHLRWPRDSSAASSLPAISLPGFGEIIFDMHRTSEIFIRDHGKRAKVVLFTGSFNNFSSCVQTFRAYQYPLPHFLFNGSGHNPVVVGPMPSGALPGRVQRIVRARTTNGGQDCGGPDAILVHTAILEPFLRELDTCLDNRPEYESLETDEEFEKMKRFIKRGQNAGRIRRGHWGDPLRREVTAVISVQSLIASEGQNFSRASDGSLFSELYAQIFNVISYAHDDQLGQYFQHRKYRERAQFISLMGESSYVTTHSPKKSLLRDQTVPEFDEPFKYYGGYGIRASSVTLHGRVRPQPINVGINFRHILLRDTAERERSHLSLKRVEDIDSTFRNVLTDVDDAIPGAVARAFYYGQVGQQEQWRPSNRIFPAHRTAPREPIDPFAPIQCLVVAADHLVPAVTKHLADVTARYRRAQAPDQILGFPPPTMPTTVRAPSSDGMQAIAESAPSTWHRAGSHSFSTETFSSLAAVLTRAGQVQNRRATPPVEVVRLTRYEQLSGWSQEALAACSSDEDQAITAALNDPRKVEYVKFSAS